MSVPEISLPRSRSARRFIFEGWLLRNIQPILAVLIVFFSFLIFGKVLFAPGVNKDESNIEMMILGALISVVSSVVSYYFGASQDRRKKSSASAAEFQIQNKDS